MLVEQITQLILDGELSQAKAAVKADAEFSRITGKPRKLNDLQARDLLEAIDHYEIIAARG